MSTNVIRLVNGGKIQVRTGVLQGVGPQGPRGQVGPPGPDGPAGPQGETGDMGAILAQQARAEITSTTSVTPDTDTNVAFATVAYDDLSVFTSSTNFTAVVAGDYLFSVYARFDLGSNAGDGHRSLWLYSQTQNKIMFRTNVLSVNDEATWVSFSAGVRASAGEVYQVKARSGDDVAVGITAGGIIVNRVGSGPRGLVGPAGPQGNVGPAGPAGPQGTPGSASSGFATYGDLL